MKEHKKALDNNFFETLWFRFFPFWPLFAISSLAFLLLAGLYVVNEKPEYHVTATIVIDEAEQNMNNSQPFRSLDPYASNPVVDNEVLVLQSRNLMNRVVTNLNLYAPLYEATALSPTSAYSSSPIIVEAKMPSNITKTKRVDFHMDPSGTQVHVENRYYPLDQWVRLSFGTVRFIRNSHKSRQTDKALYFSIIPPAEIATALLKQLEVTTVSKLSTAIHLTFTTDDARKGADVLNGLMREYLRSAVATENQLASNTVLFVDERLKEVERDLDSIERRIQQFRTAGGVIDLSEQGRIYLQTVAENDRKVVEINTQLAVLDQVQQYINAEGRRTGIVPTSLGIDDPVLARLLQELNDLELRLANTRTRVGENNPLVQSIENEIRKIRPSIRGIVNNQQQQLRASRNNLSSASNRVSADLKNIPQQERELMEISRQQAVKRDLYAFLLQRREEAALGSASAIAQSRIVDYADPTAAKPSSKKIIILLASLMLGFALGFAYIFFREGLSSSILFRSQLDKLTELPIAGEINHRKHRTPFLVGAERKTAVDEQFLHLQTALGLFDAVQPYKKLLVTSGLKNEGKTFISMNLAASIAMTGKRVLLVDMNLLAPEVSSRLKKENSSGLTAFLQGRMDMQGLVQQSPIENLDVITAGNKVTNSIGLLSHLKLDSLFKFLEERYDFIIIDTPPTELAPDASLLSRYADLSLYVVRHRVTPKAVLRQLDDHFAMHPSHPMYLVFNGIKGRGFLKKYYGYGFGYGNKLVLKDKAYAFAQ